MTGRIQGWQATTAAPLMLCGIGVHSGKPVNLTIRPAEPGHGIVFLRTGLENGLEVEIPSEFDAVSATELCTVVGDPRSGAVSTVEHLLAALRGLGIDNALVEVDGPEMPIMDGSASSFVEAIDGVGILPQAAPRRFIKVLKPVSVRHGGSVAELLPYDGFRLDVEIDFDTPLIGRQRFAADMDRDTFRRDLSRARTFGFMRDVERLWAAGYALGASLDNTVVLGEDRVVNPEGLRYADEFVRHKTLDAVGDLALAGLPLLALYRAKRPGHRLNHAILAALFADRGAWTVVDGASRRGEGGHAEPVRAEAGREVAAARPARVLASEMS